MDRERWLCQPRVVVKTLVREVQFGLGQTIHMDPLLQARFVPRCDADMASAGWLVWVGCVGVGVGVGVGLLPLVLDSWCWCWSCQCCQQGQQNRQ